MGVQMASSHAVAAWADRRGVFAAVAGVGGRFGAPQQLSHVGELDDLSQILATDARGDALVLWQRPYHDDPVHSLRGSLFAAFRRAGGEFGKPRLIARDALDGYVGMDGHGNAVIAWDHATSRSGPVMIDVVDRHADGQYGGVTALASDARRLGGLAENAAGQAVIVWNSGSPWDTGIEAETRQPGGRFTAPMSIVPASVGGEVGSVGIDSMGQALIAWEGPNDGASSGNPFVHAQVTTLKVGATAPRRTQTLLTPSLGQLGDNPPQIDVDDVGDAVVAWENETLSGRQSKIVVARNARGGPFAAPEVVGTSYLGGNFDLAIGPAGQAIIAWDSLTAPVHAVIAASPTSPYGRAASFGNRGSVEPAVTVGPHGRALTLWWDTSPPWPVSYARTG